VTTDTSLLSAIIDLLREMKTQQEDVSRRLQAQERAILSLSQGLAQLDDRRVSALVGTLQVLAWSLSIAVVIAGALIAAALVWGG
jgi:hypothetical protein